MVGTSVGMAMRQHKAQVSIELHLRLSIYAYLTEQGCDIMVKSPCVLLLCFQEHVACDPLAIDVCAICLQHGGSIPDKCKVFT